MSPGISNSMISALSLNNSDSMTLMVLKLCNDGSNWADYKPHIQRALGSKGLWRHIEGIAIVPKPYMLVAGVPILADGITPTMEDQIEAREMNINDYNKHKYLTQHVIFSTTSTCLGNKIKNLKTSHHMWDAVKWMLQPKAPYSCLMQRTSPPAWSLQRMMIQKHIPQKSNSTSSSWANVTTIF